MLKRSITGFFILLALAGFLALRVVSFLFFDAFILVIIYGCLFEILRVRDFHKHKLYSTLLYIYPALLALIYNVSKSVYESILIQVLLLVLFFIVLMFVEIIGLAMNRKNAGDVDNKSLLDLTKQCMEIVIYPITLLSFMFGLNHLGLETGYMALILALSITIITDVFAFLFGSLIKGPKFAPEISPGKTISGCCFGALGGIIISVACFFIFKHVGYIAASSFPTKTFIIYLVCGLFGTLATMFGDLVESAYKRKLGVKDMGNLLPGHGGFMDRVDGLMFTSALVFIIFALFI